MKQLCVAVYDMVLMIIMLCAKEVVVTIQDNTCMEARQ